MAASGRLTAWLCPKNQTCPSAQVSFTPINAFRPVQTTSQPASKHAQILIGERSGLKMNRTFEIFEDEQKALASFK